MRSPYILLLLTASAFAQDVVLDKWLDRQKDISSLDAPFTQERKLPSLKEPVSTPGRLSFSKPDKFRWQLGEPMQTLAVSDGETFTLIEESEKSARQISKDSPQASRFSLMSGKAFGSREAFYETFEVTENRVTGTIHQYTLKPKDRRMRSNVPWVFIDIDPAKNEMRAMELELQDKSRIRTLFGSVRLNPRLSDSLFKPDLSGYKLK